MRNAYIPFILAASLAGGALSDLVSPHRTALAAPLAPALSAFSDASKELNRRIHAAQVRIHVDQSAAGMLSPALKGEFDDWLKSNRPGPGSGAPPRRSEGRPPGGGRDGLGPFGRSGGGGGGDRSGGGGGGLAALVVQFLQQKADKLDSTDPTESSRLRGLIQRVEIYRGGLSGDLNALVIDSQGHAILLAGLLREAHTAPLQAFLPDNTPISADFVGANLWNGYCVVKLQKLSDITPMSLAPRSLDPGELLFSISASQGGINWTSAPGRPGEKIANRFAASLDDRSGAFIFDINGDLAALVSGSYGGWQNMDRQALAAPRLARELAYIIRSGRDVDPVALGVRYDPVADSQGRQVKVREVIPGSLADKSGLKRGDILISIDSLPLSQLPQVLVDMRTRQDRVPLGLLRDGATLQIMLASP